MFCPNCGARQADSDRFCAFCGARLAVPEAPSPVAPVSAPSREDAPLSPPPQPPAPRAKMKFPLKALLIAAGGALVLAALVILAVWLLPGTKSGSDTQWVVLSNKAGDKSWYYWDEELVYETRGKSHTTASLDLQTRLVICDGELLLLKEGAVQSIAQDVEKCSISNDGSTFSYIDDRGDLYRCLAQDPEPEEIAGDVLYAAVSPTGQYVAYLEGDLESGWQVCLYRKGSVRELADDLYLLSVSDDGDLFCKDAEGTLYTVDPEGDDTLIARDTHDALVLNSRNTELIYVTQEGTYVWTGEDSEKLGSSADYVYPLEYPFSTYSTLSPLGFLKVYIADFSSMAEHFYCMSSIRHFSFEVCFLDEDHQRQRVTGDSMGIPKVCRNGKYLFYADRDWDLFRVSASDPREKEKLAEEVTNFAPVSDGKAVYYLDSDGDLWYLEIGEDKPSRIDRDVRSLYISHDDYLFYSTEYEEQEGLPMYAGGVFTLCWSRQGSKGETLMEDVFYVHCDDVYARIFADARASGDFTAYLISQGTELAELER